jgi:hypothetical protein
MDEYASEFGRFEDSIKRICMIKYRDIIHETVQEYNRKGEFVRIFPSRGSKQYEKYFSGLFGTKMLNRIVHKILYSNEILPYDKPQKGLIDLEVKKKSTDPKNLKYETDGVP